MRRVRLAFGVGVMAITLPRFLIGQSPTGLPQRLQPASRAVIERLADSLTRESLPTAPIYDKAAEGVLKGADDGRIIAAVRGLAQRLRDARTLLGAGAPEVELSAAASALHAGAPAATIKQMARARDERAAGGSLAVPLVVLANLLTDGVPSSIASESLTALVERGARDEELTALRWTVARDIDAGKSPPEAASGGTHRLLQTIEARSRRP